MKNVIIYNADKSSVLQDLNNLIAFFGSRIKYHPCVGVWENFKVDDAVIKTIESQGVSRIIVLGGDGTFLGQARKLLNLNCPMVGINYGTLGFLAAFNVDEFKDNYDYVFGPNPKIGERDLLNVSVVRNSTTIFNSYAANDAVITAGPPFRMIKLNVFINPAKYPEPSANVRADGLIISTSLGSTAYNLSANGPIVHPKASVFCVTPISPHSLSMRPIVVSSMDDIKVELLQVNKGTTLVIDGQESVPLNTSDQIVVQRATNKLKVILHPDRNYWDVLRQKMNWALPPK